MGKIKEQVESKVEEILSKPYRIDLHNDDYNSFDWVITCLMKYVIMKRIKQINVHT